MAMMSRWKFTKVQGTAAFISTLAAAALLLALGVTTTSQHGPASMLAIAAAMLQLLSGAMLIHVFWRAIKHNSRPKENSTEAQGAHVYGASLAIGIVLSTTAGAASVATFIWMKILLSNVPGSPPSQKQVAILICSVVLWILSAIVQASCYTTLLIFGNSMSHGLSEPIPLSQDLLAVSELSRPGTARTLHASPPLSPHPSFKNSSLGSSLRSSLTIAVGPATSKTKLITRQQSCPTSIITKRTSTDSAFDSWDTSSISPHLRETVLRSSPVIARNPLAPIPGSRSPSPAKALEGPFYPRSLSPNTPPSTAGSQPSSPPPTTCNFNSSHSHFITSKSQPSSPKSNRAFNFSNLPNHSRPSVFRGRSSTESLPHLARTRSASVNGPRGLHTREDHIHPLFRSSSPTPPPSATPGTIVTAVPGSFAGLLMHERMIRRMRSGSAPNSPSPLATDTGYFFAESGLGIRRTEDGVPDVPPLDGNKEREDADSHAVDGTNQEERKMTPPIPEFILATAKADWTGYERRKSETSPDTG